MGKCVRPHEEERLAFAHKGHHSFDWTARLSSTHCSYYRPEEPMPSPILALQHNITYAFENPNGSAVEQLRRAVEEGRVSRELGFGL